MIAATTAVTEAATTAVTEAATVTATVTATSDEQKIQPQTQTPPKIRPNTITYATVMDAHARRGDIDGANEVWEMMKDDYFNSGNTNAKPNLTTYNILIDAHAKAKRKTKRNTKTKTKSSSSSSSNNENGENGAENSGNESNSSSSSSSSLTNNDDVVDVDVDVVAKVEKILSEIHHAKDNGQLTEGPDKITYKSMIACLEKYEGTEDRVRALTKEASKLI